MIRCILRTLPTGNCIGQGKDEGQLLMLQMGKIWQTIKSNHLDEARQAAHTDEAWKTSHLICMCTRHDKQLNQEACRWGMTVWQFNRRSMQTKHDRNLQAANTLRIVKSRGWWNQKNLGVRVWKGNGNICNSLILVCQQCTSSLPPKSKRGYSWP